MRKDLDVESTEVNLGREYGAETDPYTVRPRTPERAVRTGVRM